MKERVIPPRRSRKVTTEYLNGEENNPENPLIYIKSEGLKEEIYSFYLRFLGEHFIPCSECQDKIHTLLYNSSSLILGNNAYYPEIEFSRKFETIDESWKEIINRPATEEDIRRGKADEIQWWA